MSKRPYRLWTKEKCFECAKLCSTKTEFTTKYNGGYHAAMKNGWWDEISSHMLPQGDLYRRIVYRYQFPNKHVYVGLTCNPNKRHQQHCSEGTVFKHSNKTGHPIPEMEILTELISTDLAAKKEIELVEEYSRQDYSVLNKNRAGGIGGTTLKWTFENCQEEALKYKTRTEFQRKSSAYGAALEKGWLNDICGHMVSPTRPNGYWNDKSNCINAALTCNTRNEFIKKFYAGYDSCKKHGWLEEACVHMFKNKKSFIK
jgi:predicted GIY-YIG superfamily endonuclease